MKNLPTGNKQMSNVVNFMHEKTRRDMVKHYIETGDEWALDVLKDIPGWIARRTAKHQRPARPPQND